MGHGHSADRIRLLGIISFNLALKEVFDETGDWRLMDYVESFGWDDRVKYPDKLLKITPYHLKDLMWEACYRDIDAHWKGSCPRMTPHPGINWSDKHWSIQSGIHHAKLEVPFRTTLLQGSDGYYDHREIKMQLQSLSDRIQQYAETAYRLQQSIDLPIPSETGPTYYVIIDDKTGPIRNLIGVVSADARTIDQVTIQAAIQEWRSGPGSVPLVKHVKKLVPGVTIVPSKIIRTGKGRLT